MGSRAGIPNKHKPFRAALNRAVDEAGGDPQALDKIASALIRAAKGGDIAAIKEIADRLDGKPAQAIVGSDEDPAVKLETKLEWVVVDPKEDGNGNGSGN